MDATRADVGVHRRGPRRSRSTRARRRSTSPTPSATRCRDEYAALPDAALRARARPARRRALGPLPRRPRAGGRQLAGRRAGRRAAGRVRGQRHRRARGQRVAGGADHAAAHAPRRARLARPAPSRPRSRATSPPGVAPDRLPGPAQQGDRRPQRVRARVRHPPGRRAQGAHDLRDHGRAHGRPGRQLARARQALRPPRAAPGAGGARLRDRRRRRSTTAFKRFKEIADRKKQVTAMDLEALVTDELRADVAALHARVVRRRGLDRAARRTRRSPSARPRARSSRARFTGDGPIDAIFRAINAATEIDARLREFRVDAVTGGQDALGEVSVVVELGDAGGRDPRRHPRRARRRARHRRRPGRRDRHHRGGGDRLRPRALQRGAPGPGRRRDADAVAEPDPAALADGAVPDPRDAVARDARRARPGARRSPATSGAVLERLGELARRARPRGRSCASTTSRRCAPTRATRARRRRATELLGLRRRGAGARAAAAAGAVRPRRRRRRRAPRRGRTATRGRARSPTAGSTAAAAST